MNFEFNIYSTPLLFAFLQGWIYAILFWIRASRYERLSDGLFGCVLAALTFEIWEYLLGFGGIEILWQELEFFPRNFGFLLPPLVWFYLKSQFNPNFAFRWADLRHALPFLLYLGYHILVFAQGRTFVEHWKENVHYPFGFHLLELALSFILEVIYFYLAWRLYRDYRKWIPSQFSNVETVSFSWFRNFLLAFVSASIVGWGMTLIDFWLDLDFWHDWWDELFKAGLIYYLSIAGYAQLQVRKLRFIGATADSAVISEERAARLSGSELALWKNNIENLMEREKVFLIPELTLNDLAQKLNTNSSILSAVINAAFEKNFNDFVNTYRVEAVKEALYDPQKTHLSLLGIGLECGFNSKSTFNRAFKKTTGLSPSEFYRSIRPK
ncbi:MAG TPA: helix-turn-helix transcriptional regulator [Saprospiraceae bacterium]|nr:helix-turn-helix transcriptional regulator [Saprospiraceae bacterium]HMQ84297.1 helix-turn-helix transcriptional regulator [Saprospiraceae bacterium]